MNIAVAVRLMPKAGDELEVRPERYGHRSRARRDGDQRVRRSGARGGRPHQGGHRRHRHRRRAARRRGSSRPCGWRTRAGRTGSSWSTPASSTPTTRGRRRSPSRRRSARSPPTSCWSASRRRTDLFGQTGAPPRGRSRAGRRRTSSSGSAVEDGGSARRAGVRRRAPRGARAAAAGRRRRPVGELAAALRLDGPSAPGHDGGEPRAARGQRHGARRGARARVARPPGVAGRGDDARGRRRGRSRRRSSVSFANRELW